ncbi:MAG TPA: DUF2723 domain-containing protein, partial [Chitinophagaceae bacterium]|nr:DUF2723 domain-containing protein [Chitinophagaceae bacterium]
EGHNREIMYYQAGNVSQETYFPLYDAMKNVLGKPTEDPTTHRDVGPETFPVKRFSIPVDTNLVRKNGTVNPDDSVVSEINFELNRSSLQRNDLMILNIIAANNWKRPIYFSMPPVGSLGSLGFGDYLRQDGLTYRLVPVKMHLPDNNWIIRMYFRDINENFIADNLLNKFVFASKKGTYFDEENRRHIIDIRSTYAEAAGILADRGKKDIAKKLLEKCDSMINDADAPYAMAARENQNNVTGLLFLEASYKAGDSTLAKKLYNALKKDFDQQKRYYDYLKNNREELFAGFDGRDGEAFRNEQLMQLLDLLKQKYAPEKLPILNNNSPSSTNPVNKPDSSKTKDTVRQKK